MIAYLNLVDKLRTKFDNFDIRKLLQDQNLKADLLANLGATTGDSNNQRIHIVILQQSTLQGTEPQQ